MITKEFPSSNVYNLRVLPWTLRKMWGKDKIYRLLNSALTFNKKTIADSVLRTVARDHSIKPYSGMVTSSMCSN